MFHVVAKPWISGKSCEIHKNLPNTCCHNIFETYNIFELTLAVGVVHLPENIKFIKNKNTPNLLHVLGLMVLKSSNGHNVKSFAIGAFLKWKMLLKEQMKISVVVKQIENCLPYFFLSKSKQVVQLVIISRKKEIQMHHISLMQ